MLRIACTGSRFTVTLDPPAPGRVVMERFSSYSEAVGFATVLSVELDRTMTDATGQLSAMQLAALKLGQAFDEIEAILTAPKS
jgi:hypothetical protein